MGAILIKTQCPQNQKLFIALAKKLGDTVLKLSPSQIEEIELGKLMKKEKTGKFVSRNRVFECFK